ncbi:aquaporin-like [Onthophagus taurus]|uniref:aquaporin-like n=1 Tax=Onthophagus taurus TaxID=166361 RepID=UPI000C2040C1|nr:aquaporin-like [Onthophagus taurus]
MKQYISIKNYRWKIYEDINVVRLLRLFFAELLGTAILVFLGCMADVLLESKIQIAFAFGFGAMVAIETFINTSGANINPAVSIGLFIMGRNALIDLPLYIIGQFVGGIAGHALMMIILSKDDENNYVSVKGVPCCCPIKGSYVGDYPACLCEFFLTFLWVVAIGAAYDWRNRDRLDSVSARIGLVITGLYLAGASISGASMNPARALGPSVNNHFFDDFYWIYYVGPLMGGIIGSVFYRALFQIPEPGVDDVET